MCRLACCRCSGIRRRRAASSAPRLKSRPTASRREHGSGPTVVPGASAAALAAAAVRARALALASRRLVATTAIVCSEQAGQMANQ